MKLFNKKPKITERDKMLLKMFEEGKVLRVNEDIDNKELIKHGEKVSEAIPEIQPKENKIVTGFLEEDLLDGIERV